MFLIRVNCKLNLENSFEIYLLFIFFMPITRKQTWVINTFWQQNFTAWKSLVSRRLSRRSSLGACALGARFEVNRSILILDPPLNIDHIYYYGVVGRPLIGHIR